jgi:CRP-like cAMP-binding protein
MMLEILFQYMNAIRPLSDDLKEVLARDLEIIEVPKRQLLLREGQTSDYIFVVIKGLLRMYYIKDGEEICSRFMEEQRMAMSVSSFYSRTPAYEYIETLEPCVLARIHYTALQKIYNERDDFIFIARVITEQYFIRSEERLFLIRKQSAEERYVYFIEHYPALLQRVPLMYIATYLGLTLETLSRIRKKISRSR